ncbi:MAG: phospholipase D family protein, partial [Xanthomonadales bacterium]|nr:phospholipase D family protein [Xanthomonadales bacterium]
LRFVGPDNPETVLLRLMILSRNLTADRSWDVAVTLEGRPTGRNRRENRSLGELIRDLPTMAFGELPEARVQQAARLAAELRRTDWEMPPGYDALSFLVLGRNASAWSPDPSKRLAVISPFATDDALHALARTAKSADVLFTRPETLLELESTTRDLFRSCHVLDEAAETEDGEDLDQHTGRDTHGLHAKVYLFERGWNTHLVLGSANATSAALLGGRNIEVLIELIGKRSRVGGVDGLLGTDGLGEVLGTIPDIGEPPVVDLVRKSAEEDLDRAREALGRRALSVRCSRTDDDDQWVLDLQGGFHDLPGIESVHAWPITVSSNHAVELQLEEAGNEVRLGVFAPASITGLIAFELRSVVQDLRVRFVLNLPIEGLPEAREIAVLKTVVRNRDGFLRYLMYLLGELGLAQSAVDEGRGSEASQWGISDTVGAPLLEELVRAYAREPERLHEIGRVVRRLTDNHDGESIVPDDFVKTWSVFELAMERRGG